MGAGVIHNRGSIRYLDRALKGAPVGILVFFLINPGLTFDDRDLAFYTGYSAPTLRGALGTLARLGLVNQLGDRRVWALTAALRQLDFSEVAGALGGDTLQDTGKENFFSLASSSIDPDSTDKDLLLAKPGEKFFSDGTADLELVEALTGAGVFPELAGELAADPWVTKERIAAWLIRLRADRNVRSVAAVLATSLKRHLDAGITPAADDTASWASIYLCPECHAAPCLCEID